ncbi:MAG: hypothetical protein WAU53_01340 [Rhodoplanes sp.]
MSLANPLWGAPRIHGELLKLGRRLKVWRHDVALRLAFGDAERAEPVRERHAVAASGMNMSDDRAVDNGDGRAALRCPPQQQKQHGEKTEAESPPVRMNI